MPTYLSNSRPNFAPFRIDCGGIPAFQFRGNLKSELQKGTITSGEALQLFENMLMVRELEEMIVKLRSGAYSPLPDFNYRGPTHVSLGQEGTAVGACSALTLGDKITSTHRGHGDSLAKGAAAVYSMDEAHLRTRIGSSDAGGGSLIEQALEEHVYRSIAELFGKEDGYCKGRGGGMHIADFSIGHLGANAIVGGGVPIATGAAMGLRYLSSKNIVCCFAGDGAYGNGVVLESLNWASQKQFTNHLAGNYKFGLPIIFLIQNNHYGMTHRTDDEVMGVSHLARRGAGFAENNMNAELINGMDPLAVRDAVVRAAKLCREGKGPVLLEASTYRYQGHSLSDPRNEYRTREEEAAWKELDPVETFKKQLLECGITSGEALEALKEKVQRRNAKAALRAAESQNPDPKDVVKYMYTDTFSEEVPGEFAKVEIISEPEPPKKDNEGRITYRDAIKQAMIEEMRRDSRVLFYGEDVADYGGAFKATKSLLETFGRKRVFNTPISEACICGSAVGAAMIGLRPVVELMYMDFTLMASDQISNQAAKWHYMSGAQVEVPLVLRVSVGGGKGYGGQHSQTLESVFTHIPGMYVVYPATAKDAKGLLKTAVRDNNPVMFVESQILYGSKGAVPEGEHLIPLGQADVKREGEDITFVTWGPALRDCLKAAAALKEAGTSAEVVDIRSLIPLDIEAVTRSIEKTGRCVLVSQAISTGSFTAEIASQIQHKAFDYLDAPIVRVGAQDGIAPQSHILEDAFLPNADDILSAAQAIL